MSKILSLGNTGGSVSVGTGSFNLYTSSINTFTSSINAWSSSLVSSNTSSLLTTASFLIYTASVSVQILNNFTSQSNYTTTASFNLLSSSLFNSNVQTLINAVTMSWNVLLGGNAKLIPTGSGSRLNIINAIAGNTYTLKTIQDATGSKGILNWPSGTFWAGGFTGSFTTGSGKVDMFIFYYDGDGFYGSYKSFS